MAKSVHFVGDGGEHHQFLKHKVLFTRFIRNQLSNGKRSYCVVRDFYILPSRMKWEGELSLAIQNAGGKSEISEAFSIDYFNRVHNTYFTIYEKQVQYWIDYKMVDYITSLFDDDFMEVRVGISVTRAMLPPGKEGNEFTLEQGVELLDKKIRGLIIARNSVIRQQNFFHSVLHIWCQSKKIADVMEIAAQNLNPIEYNLTMKGSFCILVTHCSNPELYTNYYGISSFNSFNTSTSSREKINNKK